MKTKKIISILMIMFIVIANLQIIKAKGDYGLNTVVKVEENNELKLEITISNADLKIIGMQGTINYNQDILELKELKTIKDGWNITALNKETGAFLLEITDDLFYDESAYIESGDKILEAIFNIKDNKNTEIKIDNIKMVNSNFDTVEVNDNLALVKLNNSNIVYIIIAIGICAIIVILVVITKLKNK